MTHTYIYNTCLQNDMKKLEEQFETDFAVWKREYETTMKLRECERENYIRQQSRAERDRQIESIIAKVDGEALKNQQDFEIKMKYEHKCVYRSMRHDDYYLIIFNFSYFIFPDCTPLQSP